ncbi:hypothetical protein TSAR_003524 [Trichomalopsis sarcophagae]|uniref:SEFIR domain-containing protein n=1 Tax=Trichomalopsis sarcophagae TaxID=543379 RepID=A0A232FM14_9HYME|nr:hypothetical protein TSAR_003524 [Trichomalopsis sarcophagae]
MFISYVVLAIMCYCTSVSSSSPDLPEICHYNLDYACTLPTEKQNTTSIDLIKHCTVEDIPKIVTLTVMDDDNNSTSQGVIAVSFKSPSVKCRYKVVLFVNPYINNVEDCMKYQFAENHHAEIHSSVKNVCPNYDKESDERELETVQSASDCKDNLLTIWYEYIYTGCYSLAFEIKSKYIFVSNDYVITEYKKVDVTEPKLRCTYKDSLKGDDSSVEMVTLAADISLLAGPLALRLEVVTKSLSLRKNNEDDFCRLIPNPVIDFLVSINMKNSSDLASNNCSLTTTSLPNGDVGKSIECNFIIQNSRKDVGYCFVVHLIDDRCHIHTSWKPPLIDRTIESSTITTEEINNENVNISKLPRILYLILFVAILLIVLAVLSTIFIAYRIHVQRKKNSSNTKIKKDFEDDGSAVLELGTSISQKEKLVKESGIVILYTRESDEFMAFMAELRKCLKQHTGCDVYDWWAPDLWNDVARVGGYEWVVKMIRKDCRVIWIDTLKARTLFAAQHKNGYDKFKQLKHNWQIQEISDFRDSVFPAIVDFAKRNNQDIDQEYQRHFVVRLETFRNADRTIDPFADLSPHARFLLPCHLDKLCSQLSVHELYFEDGMKTDKIHLGKYLPEESFVDL